MLRHGIDLADADASTSPHQRQGSARGQTVGAACIQIGALGGDVDYPGRTSRFFAG